MGDELWKIAKQFVGTVGASLGAITALLYAIGFIAKRAHLSMLGISGIEIDNVEYLKTGGLFFIHSLLSVITALLDFVERALAVKWYLLGVGLLLFLILVAKRLPGRFERIQNVLQPSKNVRLAAIKIKGFLYNRLWFHIVLIGIGLTMLPAFLNSIDGLQGLIFYTIPEDSNTQPLIALREKIAALPNPDLATIELLDRRIRLAREWESNRIRQFILEGKITPLRVSYGRLVIGVLIYSMLIVLLRSVKKNYTSRLLEVTDGIAKSGVMVLFVFLVCMLPVVFGFTIQDNKYQLCEVVVMGNEEAEQPYFLSIIGTSGEYLTVYDRLGGPHLTLYRKSDVARMRCWGAQFIFRNEHFRKQKR